MVDLKASDVKVPLSRADTVKALNHTICLDSYRLAEQWVFSAAN
jgi:hypothetical protein